MANALELHAVSKYFGKFCSLDQVDLSIQEGEFFGLLGPNGAGKTTMINIIGGLSRASSGSTKVMGYDVVSQFKQARQRIGIVPQELTFDPFFNVREALVFQSGYFGIKNNDDWIDELLFNLALTDKASSNMRALSGGMKRRVMVAQALVHKPPLILLDEPTAGVDVELRQTLWAFISSLNKKGHTILLTTHYLEEAETLCNRIAMLKKGKILTVDKTSNLLRAHATQTLTLTFKGDLPHVLNDKLFAAFAEENRYVFGLTSVKDLEYILATCRLNGIELEDCSIDKPDLEEVFVQLMKPEEST